MTRRTHKNSIKLPQRSLPWKRVCAAMRWPTLVTAFFGLLVGTYWHALLSSYTTLQINSVEYTTQRTTSSALNQTLLNNPTLKQLDTAASELAQILATEPVERFNNAVDALFKIWSPEAQLSVGVQDTYGNQHFHRAINPYLSHAALNHTPCISAVSPFTEHGLLQICGVMQADNSQLTTIGYSVPVIKNGQTQALLHLHTELKPRLNVLQPNSNTENPSAMVPRVRTQLLSPPEIASATLAANAPSLTSLGAILSETPPITVQSIDQTIRQSIWLNLIATCCVLLLFGCFLWLWIRQIRKATLDISARQHLEKLITEIPGAVFQYQVNPDRSSSFPYLSPGIHTLAGIELATFEGSVNHIFERIHTEDRLKVIESLKFATAQLTPWHHEFRILHATKQTVIWVLARAKPEKTPTGAILFHGYIQDITSERSVHKALKAQELKLNLALDAAQEGIWEYEHARDEVRWDARIRDMLGYEKKRDYLKTEQMAALVHPQDLPMILHRINKCLFDHTDGQIDFSLRLRSAKQQWLWVQVRGRVVEWDERKQPIRSMGLMRNITAEIADSQLRDALISRSVACITLVTKDRKLIEANERFKSNFLPKDVSLEDFSFHSDIHLDDEHWVAFGKKYEILKYQDQVRFEFPLRDRWGVVHWFDMHGVLREPGNSQSDVIWTWFDVSARRAADQALSLERLRLHTLLQHFPGGVLIVDSSNSIVFLNTQAIQLLAITIDSNDIEGTDYTKLPDVSDLQTYDWLEKAKHLTQGGSNRRFEVQSRDGTHLEIEYLDIQGETGNLGSVWFIRDVTQRTHEAQKLRVLAETDSLTGLPNRRRFLQGIEHLIESGWPNPAVHPGALLMLDIDHFKQLNDTYGHAAGDKVLTHVAQLIRHCLRSDDLPARLGGEEFAILLPHTTTESAFKIAERIRLCIQQQALQLDRRHLEITISIGLCSLDAGNIEQTMSRADQALYAAKDQGRNRTVIWQANLAEV